MKIEEILSIDANSTCTLAEAIFGDNEDLTPDEREVLTLSLIHISEPRDRTRSRMPSSA